MNMDWLSHHKISERLAAQAHVALQEGREAQARDLFRRAAAAEEWALRRLDPAKAHTFGITAVSAVALWYKSKALKRAMRLAGRCLARPGLMPAARQQLEQLCAAMPRAAAPPLNAAASPPHAPATR